MDRQAGVLVEQREGFSREQSGRYGRERQVRGGVVLLMIRWMVERPTGYSAARSARLASSGSWKRRWIVLRAASGSFGCLPLRRPWRGPWPCLRGYAGGPGRLRIRRPVVQGIEWRPRPRYSGPMLAEFFEGMAPESGGHGHVG